MKCKLIISSIIFLCFSISVSATEWAKTYDMINADGFQTFSMQQTKDGGCVVAGVVQICDIDDCGWFSPSYACVLKLDSDGNISWQKVYGGGLLWSVPFVIQQTADGGYIVVGETDASNLWISKLGRRGNISWQRIYRQLGKSVQQAHAVQQTADGGYIVAGLTHIPGANPYYFWILKLGRRGNIIWQKTYGEPFNNAVAHTIRQTTDGGYVVSGIIGNYGHDILLLKLDRRGNISWQKTYGEPDNNDEAYSIQQTKDEGYIMAGSSNNNALVLKLDSSGNMMWQKSYYPGEEANSIQQTADGGYVLIAASVYDVPGMLKLDSSGNVMWRKNFFWVNEANSIQQTADGGYIVAGGNAGIWVIKLGSNGDIPGCDLTFTIDCEMMEPSLSILDTIVEVQPSHAITIPTLLWKKNIDVTISDICEIY